MRLDIEHRQLMSLKNILDKSMVKFIQFEYGGTYLDAGTKLNDLIGYLGNYGYKVYSFNGEKFTHLINFNDDYRYDNFIATKENI